MTRRTIAIASLVFAVGVWSGSRLRSAEAQRPPAPSLRRTDCEAELARQRRAAQRADRAAAEATRRARDERDAAIAATQAMRRELETWRRRVNALEKQVGPRAVICDF